jgi:hypothetical protein
VQLAPALSGLAIWRVKPKGRSAPKAMPRRGSAPAGQETEVARLTRERDEALGQQAATADVLQIISSSPANLDTVLETILANATRGHASRASARAALFSFNNRGGDDGDNSGDDDDGGDSTDGDNDDNATSDGDDGGGGTERAASGRWP